MVYSGIMIAIYSPESSVELALIKSILDSENIPYHVRNEHFGSMRTGPDIELLNRRTFMVPEDHAERAAELIEDFLSATRDEKPEDTGGYTFLERMRLVLEFLMFGWIVPRRR